MKRKPHPRQAATARRQILERRWPNELPGGALELNSPGWERALIDRRGLPRTLQPASIPETEPSFEESKAAVRAGIQAGIESIDRMIALLREQDEIRQQAYENAQLDRELSRMTGPFTGRVLTNKPNQLKLKP